MPLTLPELQDLDRLLNQVLDLPSARRARWIDTLQPPHDRFSALLRTYLANPDGPATETADFLGGLPVLQARTDHAADPVGGERVGPYRLARPLGQGGMSSVWLAEQVEGSIRREVALKLPHRHLLDRGLAARMQVESDILAGLSHDNIARLYDAGVDAQGRPYLAIEYVPGLPVDVYCAEHRADLATRIRLMVQVVRAVAYAHASLVVHRDLKPSNILVAAGGAGPSVKLLDFGIAKLLTSDDNVARAADLTQSLGRVLTPDYASPEQLMELPVTTASDIYSLGVVLYQVVTGEKPYQLKRESAQSLAEAVINADVLRPSKRGAPAMTAPGARRIDGDLDAIIMKALKPSPGERYGTASALGDDLERFIARQPVLARPDSLSYRSRRFVQRHALATAAAAMVFLALTVGAGLALWQARAARLEANKTAAVKQFLQSIITVGSVDQQDALLRRRQPIGEVLVEAAKTIPDRFADQAELRAELQGLIGNALADLSLHESARTLRETRLAELSARQAPLAERMNAQVELAVTLADSSEPARSMELLQDAVRQLESASDPVSRRILADALRELSVGKALRYDESSGVADAQRSVRISEEVERGSKAHVTGLARLGFAYALASEPDLTGAEKAFTAAIALAGALPVAERGFEATVRRMYAESLIPARRHLRALAEFKHALRIVDKTSGRDSFRWARTAVVTANLLSASGDAPAAKDLFSHAIRIYERYGTELDPLFISTAHSMNAQCLIGHGEFDEAHREARRALAPQAAGQGGAYGASWLAKTRYALVLQAIGQYALAESVLNDALAGMASRKNSDVPNGERLLALNHIYRGNPAAAEPLLMRVMVADEGVPGRFVSQRNFGRMALAQAYFAQNKLADAEREVTALADTLARVADDDVAVSRPVAAQVESLQGRLRLKRGDTIGAAAHFAREVSLLLPRSHGDSPYLASARAQLALALLKRGNPGDATEARKLAAQARTAMARHTAVGPHLRDGLIELERALGSAGLRAAKTASE